MKLKQHIGKQMTVSPSEAGNWLAFTLDHIEKGTATISLTIRPEMTNPYKHIHGGMMALVIDESVGWAVLSLESEVNYTTLSLNVDFLYAIKVGERLKAKSTVVRAGKKIINVECLVYDMQDRLLAKASSNLINTGMQRERIEDKDAPEK
ncbi:MAG: PaaI family thioesterase [Bacteroidota bacterium]